MAVTRIVSGGQTGADRGGLDAAIGLGLEHGGWCPRGRRAEDGAIPSRYALAETGSSDYAERTERNVIDSDATVLITRGMPTGGSALTARLCARHHRPLCHLDLAACSERDAATRLREWLASRSVAVLNVAGSRESSAPGLAASVRRVVTAALAGSGR
jgi:hypothetical protein